MDYCYAFINLLIPNQIPVLLGRLIQDYGYSIQKIGRDLTISSKEMPTNLLSIRIYSKDTHATILSNIQKCLALLKISYFSIIVTESCACTWNVGRNFNPPKKIAPKPSYLKLVKEEPKEDV